VSRRRDNWTIDSRDYETEEAFRAAVAEELARFEHIGYRQGFGIVAAPIRQRIDGSIVTLGWEFRAERIPLVRDEPEADAGPLPDAPEPEVEDGIEMVDSEANQRIRDAVEPAADERLDGEPEAEIPEPVGVVKDKYAE
jgi:hypothetical protein